VSGVQRSIADRWSTDSPARSESRGGADFAAGVAFVVVLEADLRLTGRNVDDLMILGRPFVPDPARARAVGGAIHALNSLTLACLYAILERRIPGPAWLKGVALPTSKT
jgi:hypothetical protein